MVILRDENGKIIGTMESEGYVSTRKLRARRERELCDKACGIVREPKPQPQTPEAMAEHEFESRFIAQINGAERH